MIKCDPSQLVKRLLRNRYTVFSVCLLVSGLAKAQKRVNFELINPLSLKREDELVVISRKFLENKLGTMGKTSFVEFRVNGKALPLQFDDLNGDHIWDEVALLYPFKQNERVKVAAVRSSAKPSKFTPRAHARHKRKLPDGSFGKDLLIDSVPEGQMPTDFAKEALPPFLTEGPAWENDRVGFRIYFDTRNGIDIWGKTTSSMVLDSVGLDPNNNYHEQSAWGMDVLKVGASLGAGSIGLFVPSYKGKDTLVRLGGNNMGKIVYEKVADGPVRAIIRLHYPKWKVLDNQKPVKITQEFSIWGGQYFYQNTVTASSLPPSARLVTGIVNLKSRSSGEIHLKGADVLYSFDTQSENHDNLGMAIIALSKEKPVFSKTPDSGTDIQNTYTASLAIKENRPLKYRFYAAWEKSSVDFRRVASFKDYLSNSAAAFAEPIIVK